MRKKTSLTIVEQAIEMVPEFKNVVLRLEQQVVLRGQSKSTLDNYIRRIALFVIRFERLPEQVGEDDINDTCCHYGCETGAVAALHTWGQNLSLHPHIHCIVSAAGYSLSGKWRHIGKYENYLYPVHQLSVAFKAKFLDSF